MSPESQPGTEDGATDLDTTVQNEDGQQDTGHQDTTQAGDTTAAPPSADGEPKTLLDAIRKVVPDTASPAAEDTKTDVKPEGVKPAGEVKQEGDDKPPPFHEHPRWKQVVGERETLKRQLGELTPDANSFRQVKQFMDQQGLNADEVKQGFAIMAALKNDPVKAWQLLEPTIGQLRTFLGHELPTDLKQKVEEGVIDEATARETAALRNRTQFTQQRSEAQQVRTAQTTQHQHLQVVANKVDEWVAGESSRDPDFKRVQPLLEGMIIQKQREWQAAGKNYLTPQTAVQLTQEAYAAVKTHLGAARPARQEIKPTPTGSKTVTTASGAKPKTLLDVVRQAAAGTYQG